MESEDNPRCTCGHMIIRSHIINMKKTMRKNNKYVVARCKFCKCRSLEIA